jgi:hypothetical protein
LPFLSPLRKPKAQNRFALAFYATDEAHVIAVMVFVHLLRQLGIRSDADVVLLHLPMPPRLMKNANRLGIATRVVRPFEGPGNWWYRHCLLKLRVFELCEYERILYADADAIPLKNLDDLFSFPLYGSLACPRAYWLPQPHWTSALFVAKPSLTCRDRLTPHIEASKLRDDYFDMEIINSEFARDMETLPVTTFCLNSEWEQANRPGFFPGPVEAFESVSVVHFTALGKPWTYTTAEAETLRPNAHPIFYELWEKWRDARRLVLTD